jgi:exopolysaccharide biosynthesis WecB/TagA/CpsF family protein
MLLGAPAGDAEIAVPPIGFIYAPPTRLTISGVPFAPLSRDEAVAEIRAMLRSGRHHHIVLANAHTVNCGAADPAYRRILQHAALVLRDGVGVEIASALAGHRLRHNFVGTDFVPYLLDAVADCVRGVFLFGAGPGVAAAAAAALVARSPAIRIAGVAHGYEPSAEVVARIRAARPDIVLVALGNPLQERWIAEHLDALEVPVAIGVGALFDYLAGRVRRAPAWLRRLRGEWLFRIAVEPRRLWRRYIIGNAAFVWRVLRAPTEPECSHSAPQGSPVLAGRESDGQSMPPWARATDAGWLPESGKVIVQIGECGRTQVVLDIARDLLRFLGEWRPALSLAILDPQAAPDDWADVPVEVITDGPAVGVSAVATPELLVPRLWFEAYALITVTGCVGSSVARLGNVLSAQADMLRRAGNRQRLSTLAYEAHRLAPSDLAIVCGTTTTGPRREQWWAMSASDIQLERAVAAAAHVEPERLPLLRVVARHELLPAGVPVAGGIPDLRHCAERPLIVALRGAADSAIEMLHGLRRDATAARRNLGKIPAFVRRRLASRPEETA